jgi:orotidine-5'-phosphate decarboxylase
MAHAAGLDGVVCSALEADAMRRTFGYDFFRVTPGIRPAGTASGDQHRIMTPARAMAAGSSHLVIGRPVTEADDPVAVLKQILSETGVENPSMD